MRNTFLTLVALCLLFLIPNTTFATSPDKSDSLFDIVSECVPDEIAPKNKKATPKRKGLTCTPYTLYFQE